MSSPLEIRPKDLATVRAILHNALGPGARVWVFGSRSKGGARRGSDLDLAVDAGRALTLQDTAVLNAAFEDSDLPYRVDVVDWRSIDRGFAAIIEPDRIELDLAEAAGL